MARQTIPGLAVELRMNLFKKYLNIFLANSDNLAEPIHGGKGVHMCAYILWGKFVREAN